MRILKIILKFLFVGFVLAASIFLLWVSNHYTVPVMMYHNVENLDHHEANWVNPKHFEYQMRYLKEHGYNVISLDQFMEMSRANQEFSRKTVVITFDDGYENNYTEAFPILQEYKFPATIFIPPDRIGQDGYLSWEELKTLTDSDIFDVGSHGLSGNYLPGYTVQEQKRQIEESKRILEEKLGTQIKYLAYPIGGFSEDIKKMVQGAGYRGAVATNRGYDRYNKDLYEVNRTRFSNKDNRDIILWVKLSGYYNLFRGSKAPY